MAAVDYFLKIDGVEGESKDSKHKGEIDVLSWSWGESNSGSHATGGGGGAGKVAMQDFHFTMKVNKASPKLLQNCASGKTCAKAMLTCRKSGSDKPQEYLLITFTDVIISSFQTGGSGGSDIVPVDQISLNFAKIEYEYKEQKPDGSLAGAIKAGWDLKKNEAVG